MNPSLVKSDEESWRIVTRGSKSRNDKLDNSKLDQGLIPQSPMQICQAIAKLSNDVELIKLCNVFIRAVRPLLRKKSSVLVVGIGRPSLFVDSRFQLAWIDLIRTQLDLDMEICDPALSKADCEACASLDFTTSPCDFSHKHIIAFQAILTLHCPIEIEAKIQKDLPPGRILMCSKINRENIGDLKLVSRLDRELERNSPFANAFSELYIYQS